jgi:hypothetical protein
MTMKKLVYLTLFVLFTIILGACVKATPQSIHKMINPGDKIGDFLITTGNEDDAIYSWDLDCVKQGEGENYSCKAPVGKKINLSVGIYDDTYSGKLDDVWSGHTYELFIENRPVNLKAFGFIDVKHPQVGMMRHWNVAAFADKPGEITLHDSGVVHDDHFESTMTYTFSAP